MPKDLTILEAKFEAQKLAFGPIYFQAIIAMKKLGILQVVSKYRNGIKINEIASELALSRYGVEVLLEAAASAGIVEITQNEIVKITKVGVIVNSDELTKVNFNFVNDVCYEAAKYTTESVKNGKAEGLKVFGSWDTVYAGLSELPKKVKKSWFEFDHYYSDDAFNHALEIVFRDEPKVLFDVGGNTGKWAITCCKYNPDVQVKILDLPGQVEVAKKNIVEQGFEYRINFHEINLLDVAQKIPSGASAIWMSQFLDCFSENEISNILKNIYNSSEKETSIFILETFVDNQKYPAAEYSLKATSLYFTTVANGNSKMYSENKMIELAQNAGFKLVEKHPLIGNSYHTLLKLEKK